MPTYGFKDMRGAAELMLSPARPAGRISVGTGSLRLDIGGVVDIPGIITKASQLTGAVRQTFAAAVAIKQTTQMIGGLMQQTVADFDRLKSTATNIATSGIPLPGVSIGGALPIPGVQSFFQFSTLPQGAAIPPSYQSILKDRRNQMQALTSRLSSIKSAAGFGGVMIQENYSRTPYPLEGDTDLPSSAKMAVGGAVAQRDDIIKDKAKFVVAGVPVAQGKPSFWSRLTSLVQIQAAPGYNATLGQMFKDRKTSGGWSEPPSSYASQFPYNKAQVTESGHIFELDDTPAAERIHIFHRSGSFIEWHPNGTVVYKNMKDGYLITMGNQHIKVSGNCHIAVDGNATVYAKKDLNIQGDGDITVTAKKDFNVFAKNINLRAKQTFKADGMKVDLRFITLPMGIIPVMEGALVPRLNLAALIADFPDGNFEQAMQQVAKGKLDPKAISSILEFKPQTQVVAIENPLSNPSVYAKTTPAAIDYRSRLFDTPEETQNFEVYTAHIDAQRLLGDIPEEGDPRALGGMMTNLDTTAPNASAPVTYLDFETYKGNFVYDPTHPLSKSYVLQDLVDVSLFPDVVEPMKVPTPTGYEFGDSVFSTGTTGAGRTITTGTRA